MPDLLIELFSEEIPARMQARAAEDLRRLVTDGLVEAGLTYAGAKGFATPRRLTLAIEGLLAQSPKTREERRGPRADAPEKAIAGFLRGVGLSRDAVEERETPKGTVLFAVIEKEGRPAAEIIAEVLERVIKNFPWPKSMRWGEGDLHWVRPLHGILCLLSDEAGHSVVPFEIAGLTASDQTYGHRFMAPAPLSVCNFDDYTAQLRRAFVVLSGEERAAAIWNEATNLAFASGLEVVSETALLNEVAGLVEWPVVLMGPIHARFLDLPPEVLQSSMREHQKFFSVKDRQGRISHFITVANRETADNGATILAGNEKVLAARLADAAFFWQNDLRVAQAGMQDWLDALENVTFHNALGSQATVIRKMAHLARELAPMVGADPDQAEEAARYAKADLSSEMVYEFPELQGIMGRYYLEAAGKPAEVARAAQEHYAPLGPADDVPSAPVSVAVSLAEKIDKLAGFWAIGEKPTGSKDPFALRRAALGVIRLVLENDCALPLLKLINKSVFEAKTSIESVDKPAEAPAERKEMPRDVQEIGADLLAFLHDRLKVYLRDRGLRHDVIDAALAIDGADDLALLVRRAMVLQEALDTPEGQNLVQGFKRANNILTQAEENDGVEYSFGADRKYAEGPEEIALFDALDAAEADIEAAMQAADFATAVAAMARLRAPIDAFFEAVKINADVAVVRRNRLNMLSRIRVICRRVADLTQVEG